MSSLPSTVAPLLLGPGISSASSHREAPLIAGLPQLDNTDVYAFRSPGNDGTVTLISNWIPFEEPTGGPNFYPFSNNAKYDINIDNNGDGKPDITYQWTFASHYVNSNTFLYNTGVVHHLTDPTLNFRQVYTLTRISYNAGRQAELLHGAGDERAGGTVRHRPGVDAELRDACAARRSRPSARARRSPARPTTRSSLICGCSTCSTAATPAGKGVHRDRAATRWRTTTSTRSR